MIWLFVIVALMAVSSSVNSFTLESSGIATMTHYDLPKGYVASCGCVGAVTKYPAAALSTMAYGSLNSYGPLCGTCVRLTLQSTPLSPDWDPITYADNDPSAPNIVVKLVDRCPLDGSAWCNATETQGNALGYQVHFDLAWPSVAIPDDFYPNAQNHDYGVWKISYEFTSCSNWAGYEDASALGSDWAQESSACCPSNPPLPSADTYTTFGPNSTTSANPDQQSCPSYSSVIVPAGGAQLLAEGLIPNTSNPLSKGASIFGSTGASSARSIRCVSASVLFLFSCLASLSQLL